MALRGKGPTAACAVVAAGAIALSACGGGGGKGQHTTAGASGTAGATGGTTGAAGTGSKTGGATPPSVKTTKPKRKRAPANPSGGGAPNASGASPPKQTKSNKTTTPALNPYQNPTKQVLKVLYRQAEEVCKYLTLDGLAREYKVQSTPDAVAKAYAKRYAKPSRNAVYRGCKAGVT